MVIKGKARGGPAALAKHLERRDTNEQVSVRELRGVTARDLDGALREMDCMAAGAVSVRTLYHAAINTAPHERLTEDQKQRAIDRLEAELGFGGQPRVVVEHLKKDREHLHVVFLRIDTGRMVAIPDSHNYRKHEIVARELEREFGHDRVQGAHIEREDKKRPARTPSHDEMQQGERSGLSPQEAKAQITGLWNQADNGRAFAAALEAEGWILARGDKRDFVIVDRAGETHSLARRIEGARAADVRQRMADIDPAILPSAGEARTMQAERTVDRLRADQAHQAPSMPIPAAEREVPLLRVPAPAGDGSSRPLAVQPSRAAAAPVVQRDPQPLPEQERLRATPEERPAPAMFRQLYSAAAEVTQRVIGTARKLLDRSPRSNEAPAPVVKPEPVTQQIEARSSRAESTVKPAPRKPARPRMTPEQIDAMLELQRARARDRDGPSL